MARILIEGNHDKLAEEIRRLLGFSPPELQLTHNAQLSLKEAKPRILLFDFFGLGSTQRDLLNILHSEKIPFIALIVKSRYYKKEQGKIFLSVREAMELGAVGVFYAGCHENIYCMEELVRRIKEVISKF